MELKKGEKSGKPIKVDETKSSEDKEDEDASMKGSGDQD